MNADRGVDRGYNLQDALENWVVTGDDVQRATIPHGNASMSAVFIIYAPPSWEREEIATINATGTIRVRTIAERGMEIGRDSRFKAGGHNFATRPVSVSVSPAELQSVLYASAVPVVTKLLTCTAALYPHTQKWVLSKSDLITYEEAATEWSLLPEPQLERDKYYVSVAMTLLGQCFTITENFDKQVYK